MTNLATAPTIAPPRCPGTGQLAFIPDAHGHALCTRCGQQVVTQRTGPHGLPIYSLHTGETARRRCAICGEATPSRLHRFCSAAHWREAEPEAFDDSDVDDFDPPWLAGEDEAEGWS